MATERKITLKGKQELEEELDILKTVKRADTDYYRGNR